MIHNFFRFHISYPVCTIEHNNNLLTPAYQLAYPQLQAMPSRNPNWSDFLKSQMRLQESFPIQSKEQVAR